MTACGVCMRCAVRSRYKKQFCRNIWGRHGVTDQCTEVTLAVRID